MSTVMTKFEASLAKAQEEYACMRARVEELEQSLIQLAELAGASPGTAGKNAIKAVEKTLKEHSAAKNIVKESGYKSLPYALYALNKTHRHKNVPLDMTVAPAHWITERKTSQEFYWKDGKRLSKSVIVPEVTAVQAQRLLRPLLPLLNELLEDADCEFINSVRKSFLDVSYKTFSKALLEALAEERGQNNTFDTEVLSQESVTLSPLPA